MARDVPATYIAPDSDRSFVPGTGKIDYGSGAAAPHGPLDLAAALRHLFGFGAAGPLIPQMWCDGDALAATAAAFPGTPQMEWRVKHDPAFGAVRLTVDYYANAAIPDAFKFRALELNKTQTLSTVGAAGALRRVTFDWTIAGMDRTYADDYHTIQFLAQGDGVNACDVVGVWVERIPTTSPIASGKWYADSFIPPDSAAYQPDLPLSSDKVETLIDDVLSLADYRYRVHLQWSAVSGTSIGADSLLSVLATLRPDDARLTAGWIKLSGSSASVYGGRAGLRSDVRYTATSSDVGWKGFTLTLERNDPLIADRQSLQQIIVDPDVGPYLTSVSLFGL